MRWKRTPAPVPAGEQEAGLSPVTELVPATVGTDSETGPPTELESIVRRVIVLAGLPALSLWYLWEGTQIAQPPERLVISASAFPRIIGICLVAAAIWMAADHLVVDRRARRAATAADGGTEQPEASQESEAVADEPAAIALDESELLINWRDLSISALLFLLYLLIVPSAGFALTTPIFLFITASYFAPRRVIVNLIFAGIFTAVIYYLFADLLQVQLPGAS
jgi:hypothetical protein